MVPRQLFDLLRPHQWAKNLLVGVPLLTAHAFSISAVVDTILAFTAFSLCASSVYIINDLVDADADREHPTKRLRPLAAGDVSVRQACWTALAAAALATAIAWFVSLDFAAILGAYFVVANLYTFVLKRKMMADVITLAALYTARVIGGGVAIGAPPSEWLLAFSMFIFLSLALVKRHSEMATRLDLGLPDPVNRDYRSTDLALLISLAAAAGYAATIVFALYLSSPAVHALYRHPARLWLVLPLLLYWTSRTIALCHRRAIHDDPIVFALRDRVSLAAVVATVLIGMAAL